MAVSKPQEITSVDKDTKKGNLHAISGTVNWFSQYGKWHKCSSKKLKWNYLHYLAIPLRGIYPKEMKTGYQRDICTPMFTEALSTIAKI